jgi:hypothetical protein
MRSPIISAEMPWSAMREKVRGFRYATFFATAPSIVNES